MGQRSPGREATSSYPDFPWLSLCLSRVLLFIMQRGLESSAIRAEESLSYRSGRALIGVTCVLETYHALNV